jgi:YidC/Oxa1 family membrane protein insertase
MEKRVLLAVILSFLVLYGYQALFPPPKPTPRPQPSAAPASQGATPSPQPGESAPQPPQPVPEVEAEALVADAQERDVRVESDAVAAVFSTRGGVLRSWKLKNYTDPSGQPQELVPQNVPAGTLRPFSLTVEDESISATLQRALFKASATDLRIQGSPANLTLEYQNGSGLRARKTFTFNPANPYLIDFSASVTRGESVLVPTVAWGPAIGLGLAKSSGFVYNPPPQPIYLREGDVTRVKQSDVAGHAPVSGLMSFAGVDDHYFLSAVIAPATPLTMTYGRLDVPVPNAPEEPARFVTWSAAFPSAPSNARFFFGPKDFDVLRSIDPQLTYAIDFGIFRWFVVPLHNALKWVHGYAGNWGWSIIILTVIINIVMFPLRHKSVVSMRKMQEIQPEVKAIQERYKHLKMSDPARSKQNTEMMNLYRERGVNPASGCVPMLLTFPVLIAFYSMLSVAIELRGAPFVLWIRDLSTYDPLYITPLLMGATQFIQTKMTPQTGADPVQQKMMLFMPIMFTGMFLWMPSGLVIYWTASNIWTIGQQVLTNRLIGPPAKRTVRPPAERRIKSAGGGKSEKAEKTESPERTDLPEKKAESAGPGKRKERK